MKIKNLMLSLVMLFTIASLSAHAASADDVKNKDPIKERVAAMTEKEKKARIAELTVRANEIKAMDISQLSKSERKALRQEIREINKEARYLDPGDVAIVILGGALFSVLLLLLVS